MDSSELFRDSFVQEDAERVAKSKYVPWDALDGKTIFITGSTGLIGSLLIFSIACRNKMLSQNIKVKALARCREKAERIFSNLLKESWFEIVVGDVTQPLPLQKMGLSDFIIHTASVTSSKEFVTKPVETINTAIVGTKNVLEYARETSAKGLLYLSSLEVYGVPEKMEVSEKDSGYIDCLQVRSCYSEGKRLVECLCCSYASEYHVPAKIARLSQTFGAGVDYADGRVFAQFARCVIEGKNIVLKTHGETYRNYCYTSDAIEALLLLLIKRNVAEAYNVANKETGISIADMARLVCKKFSNGKSEVVFDIAKDAVKLGYNPVVKICLDTAKLESLGWKATVSLTEMFERTIGSMRLRKN